MKVAIHLVSLTLATYLRVVSAVPHRAHGNLHIKKDYTTDVITEYTTVYEPQVVIWVDGRGKVVSTETKSGAVASTSAPETTSTTPVATTTTTTPKALSPTSDATQSISDIPSPAVSVSNKPLPTTPAAASSTEAVTTPAPGPTLATPASLSIQGASMTVDPANNENQAARVGPSQPAGSPAKNTQQASNLGLGIAYDILKGGGSGVCKSESDIAGDIAHFKNNDFQTIRIYGTSCDQVQFVTQYAQQNGMKVFAAVNGIDNLESDLQAIISQAGPNLHVIDTIGIGNEIVQNGGDPGAVVRAISTARSILGGLGYTGFIVTVDTFGALISNPTLCAASDYCAANCHGFFTNSVTAPNDGKYVLQQVQQIANSNPGKRVVISESGWPYQGSPNGAAIPSVQNQQAAIASLKAAFPAGDLILFEGYNALYKQPGSLGVEQFWGIYGH